VCIPLALLVMGVHCLGPLDLQGLQKEEAAATPPRRGRKGGGRKQGQWRPNQAWLWEEMWRAHEVSPCVARWRRREEMGRSKF
jgi:hypothetical protein